MDDYFLTLETEGEEDACILAFLDDSSLNFWLLGDAFLRGYYSIHDNSDHANARIGFAPHSTSSKQNVEADVTAPETNVEDYLWELTWWFDVSPKKFFKWTQFFYRWGGNAHVYWFGIK